MLHKRTRVRCVPQPCAQNLPDTSTCGPVQIAVDLPTLLTTKLFKQVAHCPCPRASLTMFFPPVVSVSNLRGDPLEPRAKLFQPKKNEVWGSLQTSGSILRVPPFRRCTGARGAERARAAQRAEPLRRPQPLRWPEPLRGPLEGQSRLEGQSP